MSIRLKAFTPILWLILSAGALCAQTTQGTITGLVSDGSGAVIPNAVVVASNTATGSKAQTVSSSTGNYVLPNLQVGTYEISVVITGFRAWVRSGVGVKGGEDVRIDVPLEVWQTSGRVVVTAEAAPLKTESTDVGTTMENKLVNDMPLAVAGIGGGMRN